MTKFTSAQDVPVFDATQAFGRPGQVYDRETNTWKPKPGTAPDPAPPESPSAAPEFDGAAYEPSKDKERLTGQLERVYEAVKDGRWLTLAGIASRTGDPEASISAQLRNLRKSRFGAWDIRKRRAGNRFEYTCAGKQSENDGQERLF